MSVRRNSKILEQFYKDYPDPKHREFFEENNEALVYGNPELLADSELCNNSNISLDRIVNTVPYNYPSTKTSEAEDLLLSLIELKWGLEELEKADQIH